MSGWIPPGYVYATALVGQHGVNKVRDDLFAGRLKASRWDYLSGTITGIDAAFWASNDAVRSLEEDNHTPRPIDPFDNPPSFQIILVWVGEEPEDGPKDEPKTNGGYMPPFMALMLKAVEHFEISEEKWPVKEKLEEFLLEQKLPNGTSVSPTQAKYLAMFSRPLAAMNDGNKYK
jgi:hypothetical protein